VPIAGNRHSEIFGGGELEQTVAESGRNGRCQARLCFVASVCRCQFRSSRIRPVVGFEIAGDHVAKVVALRRWRPIRLIFCRPRNIEGERIGRDTAPKRLSSWRTERTGFTVRVPVRR